MNLNLIEFKKRVSGTLQVSDTLKDLFITNTYFSLIEDEFPFDSLYFKKYLEDRLIIVLKIYDGVKNKPFFENYLVEDEEYKLALANQAAIQREKEKLNTAKAQERANKIAAAAKLKEVEAVKSDPIIINKEKINKSIATYFSQED